MTNEVLVVKVDSFWRKVPIHKGITRENC